MSRQSRREFFEDVGRFTAWASFGLAIPGIGNSSEPTDFNRSYSFNGKFSLISVFDEDISGNLSFSRTKEGYESKLECLGDEGSLYLIHSFCSLENGILIPRRTKTFRRVNFPIYHRNEEIEIEYFHKEQGMDVRGWVHHYDSGWNPGRVSEKRREHEEKGMDYASSILGLLLDLRENRFPKTMNIISATGKMSKQEIKYKESEKGINVLTKYVDDNSDDGFEPSIVLELDSEKELNRLIITEDIVEIDMGVKKMPV
tara:strand:+ start:540 stop:1310 length:771 start_codon:yes stop_codon:yes gene_type:complete